MNLQVPQELKIFEIANTLLDVINCVPSLTNAKSALMTQGPRDIFHGLSCLLASLSGGQSKALALLQGKMAAANLPSKQIPRFIELEDNVVRSPVSVEPAFANSPTELPYDLDSEQLRTAPTSTPFQPIHKDSDYFTTSVWMEGTTLIQSDRIGFSNHAGHTALDTAQLRDHELPWSLGMTQV
jgi:hypothetical protein